MKKRKTDRRVRALINTSGKRFTPLSPQEIGKLSGRQNLLQFEEYDYALIERMAMYMPEKFIGGVYGISEATFLRMKNRDPKLVKALESGSSNGVAMVGRSLAQMAMSKKYPGCTIFYMKTKGGMKETVNVQASQVPVGENEIQEELRKLEPEALRRIAQELNGDSPKEREEAADSKPDNSPNDKRSTRRKKPV